MHIICVVFVLFLIYNIPVGYPCNFPPVSCRLEAKFLWCMLINVRDNFVINALTVSFHHSRLSILTILTKFIFQPENTVSSELAEC